MAQVIQEAAPKAQAAVMTGPSHAEEVGRGLPTAIVVGAKKKSTAQYIQSLFMNETFRVYISPDIMGMELGSSLKNVVALAAGIADGLQFGDNTKAALITRGIHEIARLGNAMGGKYETFYGLTGIGDLIVTCASMHSRNRRAGILMGQGLSMDEAMKEVNMVVEGVYSAKAALTLARKYNVEVPIIEQVNQILFENKSAAQAVTELMQRDKKTENSTMPWEEE
jgi:glycerol-3-phosphate dehydrogenase (NAD(P)+)